VIKVVADTNVYISAILFGGNPEKVLTLARRGELRLFISPDIVAEITRVLRQRFQWNNTQIVRLEQVLREFAELVIPKETVAWIDADEADNRILECAVEAGADVIVSGDARHLLPLREFRGIKILSPAALISWMNW